MSFPNCWQRAKKADREKIRNTNGRKMKRFVEEGDILFNYGPGTQYPRVSGASGLFTGRLAYSVWRGALGGYKNK